MHTNNRLADAYRAVARETYLYFVQSLKYCYCYHFTEKFYEKKKKKKKKQVKEIKRIESKTKSEKGRSLVIDA